MVVAEHIVAQVSMSKMLEDAQMLSTHFWSKDKRSNIMARAGWDKDRTFAVQVKADPNNIIHIQWARQPPMQIAASMSGGAARYDWGAGAYATNIKDGIYTTKRLNAPFTCIPTNTSRPDEFIMPVFWLDEPVVSACWPQMQVFVRSCACRCGLCLQSMPLLLPKRLVPKWPRITMLALRGMDFL